MFKTGDKAILKISFEMVERGGDYTFDDHEDVERHVRGDMVEILRVIDNKTDKRKHDKLAVIYNPKTFASTTVAINHLEQIKGEININKCTCKDRSRCEENRGRTNEHERSN
ncbi:TPA: hypothetical protein ACHVJ6_005390 [Bacillus cereus]